MANRLESLRSERRGNMEGTRGEDVEEQIKGKNGRYWRRRQKMGRERKRECLKDVIKY